MRLGATSPMATLLIVEDNDLNRDMLSRRLARRGHSIVLACDGPEGLTKAYTTAPDLILMDMSLPVMDGWEVTRRLKRDPVTAGIPIIALTAHAMAEDKSTALLAGCDEFETKPIDFERLIDTVTRLLERRASGHDAGREPGGTLP